MPPRRKPRWVGREPPVGAFLPAGGPPAGRGRVELTVDEWESLRLADALGLEQEAAGRMGVSRSTFQRLLSAARQKVARALASGWVIIVEGGSYRVGAAAFAEGGEEAAGRAGQRAGAGASGVSPAGGEGRSETGSAPKQVVTVRVPVAAAPVAPPFDGPPGASSGG